MYLLLNIFRVNNSTSQYFHIKRDSTFQIGNQSFTDFNLRCLCINCNIFYLLSKLIVLHTLIVFINNLFHCDNWYEYIVGILSFIENIHLPFKLVLYWWWWWLYFYKLLSNIRYQQLNFLELIRYPHSYFIAILVWITQMFLLKKKNKNALYSHSLLAISILFSCE